MNRKRLFERVRRRRDWLAASLVFVLTLGIFLLSRVHQVTDSEYSMLLTQSLISHRSFTLDQYRLPRYEPVWHGYYFKNGPIYQLEVAEGHLYYHLPPGTSILSTPFVAVLNLFGVSAANPDGTYNHQGEVKIEAGLAALLMAVLACIFFYTARLLLPVGWSLIIAFGGALGTQVYSTASRALWSDTWALVLMGCVVVMLLRQETNKGDLSPVWLATLLSWSYFVRPTYAIHIIAVSIYLFIYHRRPFARYVVTGAAWLIAFLCYSWLHFGQLLPAYYRASRLQLDSFWEALMGNLLSPARGLLVYLPVLFFVAWMLVRHRRYLRWRPLVWLSLAITLGQLLVVSCFPHWWGGHSFGPRFMTGAVSWLVLLAILGARAMHDERRLKDEKSRTGWLAQLAAGGALLLMSLFINTVGATSHAAWLWNTRPLGVDEHPERLWDWRQPQFLASFLPIPPPREVALLNGERVDWTTLESEKYLWYGWGGREPEGRWTDERAALVFRLQQHEAVTLRLKMAPFIVPGKLDEQRVEVSLNGHQLPALTLHEPEPQVYEVALPAEFLQEQNQVSLRMPDAASLQKLGVGDDGRRRGIRVLWVELGR